jgi:uncharacterized protein (TIGR02466 family)
MPAEIWFPTVIFYEDVEVPEQAEALATAAVRDAVDEGKLAARKRYTAADGPQTLHLDPRMDPLLSLLWPPIRRFLFEVLSFDAERTDFYLGRCWPVVQTAGGRGRWHEHRGGVISGVFYLQAPPGSGGLEFRAPFRAASDDVARTRLSELSYRTASYAAVRHRLVLFHSELVHRGLANSPELPEPRVAIAFDLCTLTDVGDPRGGIPREGSLKRIA